MFIIMNGDEVISKIEASFGNKTCKVVTKNNVLHEATIYETLTSPQGNTQTKEILILYNNLEYPFNDYYHVFAVNNDVKMAISIDLKKKAVIGFTDDELPIGNPAKVDFYFFEANANKNPVDQVWIIYNVLYEYLKKEKERHQKKQLQSNLESLVPEAKEQEPSH